MPNEVLVAFTTRHDSTRAMAATIAAILEDAGVAVRFEAIDTVGDLRAFRAAVLGCTVFAGEWMPGAHAFLVAHERQLETIPVWLFATGPTEPLPEGTIVDVPPDLVSVIERIGPRDVALFAGSLQPHHIGAGLRVLTRLSRATFAEHRDEAAVKRWARHVAEELAAPPRVPGRGARQVKES
jgi:menaquinone-dependent protoporphyrinogen oxidase